MGTNNSQEMDKVSKNPFTIEEWKAAYLAMMEHRNRLINELTNERIIYRHMRKSLDGAQRVIRKAMRKYYAAKAEAMEARAVALRWNLKAQGTISLLDVEENEITILKQARKEEAERKEKKG